MRCARTLAYVVVAATGFATTAGSTFAAEQSLSAQNAGHPSKTLLHSVNGVRISPTELVVLNQGSPSKVGFTQHETTVAAYDEAGTLLWKKDLGNGRLFGGFDFDRDGVADFGLAERRQLGQSCGISNMQTSWLEIYSGASGVMLARTPQLEDKCHSNLNYASVRWAAGSVVWGGEGGTLALTPQYTAAGWYYGWREGRVTESAFLLPTTPGFSRMYGPAIRKIRGEAPRIVPDGHVPNGLIVSYTGQERLVVFTSGRVLQYRVAPLSALQLISDHTFSGRPDVGGRNYGLVQLDPRAAGRLALVAGTSAYTVFSDLVTGRVETDPWGGIERHVSIYDMSNGALRQRFFGSAHDGGDANRYQNRIVYPAHVFLPTGEGRSHIGFNRFADGKWTFHVSRPGAVEDAFQTHHLFVWDIRDIDGDGTVEIIASPIDQHRSSPVGAYFPEHTTRLYTWQPRHSLRLRREFSGGIPWLRPAPTEREASTSDGATYPVLTGIEAGQHGIYLRSPEGALIFHSLAEDIRHGAGR